MLLLVAVSPLAYEIPPLLASGLVGAAVYVLITSIASTLQSEDLTQDHQWRYDVNRINELRKASSFYRFFQPLIQALAKFNRGAFRDSLPAINREISAAGLPRFWTAEEYLGRIEVISMLIFPVYVWICSQMMGTAGIVFAIMMAFLTGYLLRRQLAASALYRVVLIKRRLPFVLDLLTLLMEAGSTFLGALAAAVDEFRDHAVGQEFGRVLGELHMGKGRSQALEAMRDRLGDDEVSSIIGSIIQGENLGTPLTKIFRTQADVLRLKRSQRAERIAGEAAVQMLFPAILIMASTVLIILGPFIISFLYSELFG